LGNSSKQQQTELGFRREKKDWDSGAAVAALSPGMERE
jgi:hypothetical protein